MKSRDLFPESVVVRNWLVEYQSGRIKIPVLKLLKNMGSTEEERWVEVSWARLYLPDGTLCARDWCGNVVTIDGDIVKEAE